MCYPGNVPRGMACSFWRGEGGPFGLLFLDGVLERGKM